jgi:hypothetical protein
VPSGALRKRHSSGYIGSCAGAFVHVEKTGGRFSTQLPTV